ncbi:MAG: TIGR01777 family oxidoreductase [Pirellula sp.]
MLQRRIILAGGSGFLGRRLAEFFQERHFDVISLTRSRSNRTGFVHWQPGSVGPWYKNLEGAAALINLTGRSVDCRPTKSNRAEVLRSRVQSVVTLADAIRKCETQPSVWIQASSAAIYGDMHNEACTEETSVGEGFAADVCRRWEKELQLQRIEGLRKVVLRIGFVLAANGGALNRLARLTEMGLGGAAGNGKQYISWLHHQDFCRMVLWCIENHLASGVYNATGPHPVTNSEFMRVLRKTLNKSAFLPMPSPVVRLGALLLRTDPSLALTGRKALPQRLLDLGFQFEYPELQPAMGEIFGTTPR